MLVHLKRKFVRLAKRLRILFVTVLMLNLVLVLKKSSILCITALMDLLRLCLASGSMFNYKILMLCLKKRNSPGQKLPRLSLNLLWRLLLRFSLLVSACPMSLVYFNDDEFKRARPACSLSDMSVEFMQKLDYARSIAGTPFVVNSAYRTKEYELSKGRSGTSSHCKGLAIDIDCRSGSKRFTVVSALVAAGFRRIGISSTFIHIDDDLDKPKSIWLY